MPTTRRGTASAPKARTSGQSSGPADAKSLHRETGKTDDLAANTLELGEVMTGNRNLPIPLKDDNTDHRIQIILG